MAEAEISISIQPCTESDFPLVKEFISKFRLDDIKLSREQFITAKLENSLAGFIRLRNYGDYNEVCSLGVIENYRFKGIGSQLLKEIISLNKKSLFAVTIMPELLKPFGFVEVHNYPEGLNFKVQYCRNNLSVPETYVVMVREIM